MFIAHLPAGYICSKFLKDKTAQIFVLLGSIAPDLDLFYFYTIGQRAVVHHEYPTHMPYFWVLLCLGGIIISRVIRKNMDKAFLALLCGAILHLFLDSFTGGIYWLAPLFEKELVFFTVPAIYSHWTLNFILHWTFAFEILILILAGYLFLRRKNATTKE